MISYNKMALLFTLQYTCVVHDYADVNLLASKSVECTEVDA